MFFLKANKTSAQALKKIITRYGDASGQAINVDKSSITFSRKAPGSLKDAVKAELLIVKEGGVGKYLSLPEQFGRKKQDLFTSIVDRIKHKAKSWSNRYLSTAGKMVLLQSVLSSIPFHSMTCFQLAVSLIKRIQSAITRFWWDDKPRKKKMAWISWDNLSKPKALGGLGFRDFKCFDEAFLAKLSSRVLHQPTGLLGRTLLGKYCKEVDLLNCSPPSNASHGWRSLLVGRDLLKQNLGWVIGNGQSVNVWEDQWLCLTAQERPMGPPPEHLSDMVVADFLSTVPGKWNTNKVRDVLPLYEDKILCIKPSLLGAEDKLIWLGTKSGLYTTKSGYLSAVKEQEEQEQAQHNPGPQWYKTVWNLKVAPKVKMFVWKALKKALPVGEILRERHLNVDPLCK